LIELNYGIKFGDDLIIDPTRKQPVAVVSHAHSDHLKRHNRILATAPTLEFARLSTGKFESVPLEYGKTYRFGKCTIRAEPAGHILGSAQYIVDYAGYRIVYTGDFKLSSNDTCAPARIHECDILFLDTTFGKKQFNFPDYSYLKQKLAEFVDLCLYSGYLPLIYAYNLGKAQEVMKILGNAGFSTYVTDKAYAYAEIHRRFGVDIANFFSLDDTPPENGAIILPPPNRYSSEIFPDRRKRTCFVSGWAINRKHTGFCWSDEAIPLSDHASYDDLIRYVETAKPKKTYCLFGFKDIVDDLRYHGFNAIKATLANRKGVVKNVLAEMDMFGA
jgi:putative mRNA 3-end processing factor